MAHSWSGNLVTCGNWESFWLNEGWTKYLENEIFRRINGEEAYRIRSALDNLELRSTIDRISEPSYTTLSPEINNDNPDDAFSLVPYVRGCQFLTYLRSFVGE
jgi:leukotriene-A4 hydrolase